MGRAEIISGGEDGRYQVRIDFGIAQRNARVEKLNARLLELVAKISEAQERLDIEESALSDRKAAVNDATTAYVDATRESVDPASWADELEAYKKAAAALLEQQAKTAAVRIELDVLKAEQAQTTKDRSYWAGLQLEEERPAWCVDFSEEAAGQVATIDIPGESKEILIAAGGTAPNESDGQLVAREVQDPNQAYLNAAILPGWQKFKPTYRAGVIDRLDMLEDKADVTLDAATSSAQSLDILQGKTLTNVPVVYMTCDASAFEVGDRVVVQFEGQDWASPKVIGFRTDPKECPGLILNGACDFATNRSFVAAYFADNDLAFDIWANPGSYTISLAGVTLPNTDFGEWTQRIGGVVKRRIMVYKAPHMVPCGNAGFLAVTDLDGGNWSAKIQKGSRVIVEMNVVGSPVREPAEDLIYSAFCEATPFRSGTTATFTGAGVRKQKYQTFFTVNGQ